MKTFKKLLFAIPATLVLASCSSDDPKPWILPVNEEEVITTVKMTLAPQSAGSIVTLQYQDLDGDGPNLPVVTASGPLLANTTYEGELDLLNEAASPAESVTEEIAAEAADHQFFFLANASLLTTAYAQPFDLNGNPVGLHFTLTTGNAGSGTLTVILRHQPDKAAAGVSGGDITNAGGETDVQVVLPITIE